MCKKLLLALCVAAAAAFGAQPRARPLTRLFASRASFPRLAPLSSTSKRFSPIARGAPLRAEPLSEIPTEMGEWVATRVQNDVTRSRRRGNAVARRSSSFYALERESLTSNTPKLTVALLPQPIILQHCP